MCYNEGVKPIKRWFQYKRWLQYKDTPMGEKFQDYS